MVLQDLLNLPDIFIADNREEYVLQFNHLGMLYCLDTDKDGRIDRNDFYDFSTEIFENVVA